MRPDRAGRSLLPLCRVLTVLAVCAAASLARAQSGVGLLDFNWKAQSSQVAFAIEFSSDVRPRLHDELSAKGYFFVDFYGVDMASASSHWNFAAGGVRLVRRHYYPEQDVLRFVFYRRPDTGVWFEVEGSGRRYTVSARWLDLPPGRLELLRPALPGAPASSRKLVVIDPGHGGHSYGAQTSKPIGGRHYEEKALALQIAMRIVPLFEQSPNLEVRLTRTSDIFVDLNDRIRMAEAAGADLFVSIHLNAQSSSRKTARGFEVYYLSDDARAANRQLEALENDHGIGQPAGGGGAGGEDLRHILSDLAGENFARRRAQSHEAASVISEIFARQGPWSEHSRGVKSANFRVLMNSAMPAVLAECGFIDHPADAAILTTAAGQGQIAALLFNAINLYFARTDSDFRAYLASVQ